LLPLFNRLPAYAANTRQICRMLGVTPREKAPARNVSSTPRRFRSSSVGSKFNSAFGIGMLLSSCVVLQSDRRRRYRTVSIAPYHPSDLNLFHIESPQSAKGNQIELENSSDCLSLYVVQAGSGANF